MAKHMAMLHISVSGARTAKRSIIRYAFCTLVTSVVMRVTSPAVLNLSMFEKLKRCTLAYIPSLRLQANPDEAVAPYLLACTPNSRLKNAQASITAP